MKHKIWYDTEKDVVRFDLDGDYLLSEVDQVYERIVKELEGKPYRQLLITMDKNSKFENREAREKTNETVYKAGVTEMAMVGASAIVRMMLKVILKSGKNTANGNFFKNEEEAVAWLANKR